MAQIAPNTPVIVGAGQASWPGGDAPEPVAMMVEALTRAAADAGAADALLRRVQSVAAVETVSRAWTDPARLVADRLGLHPRETVRTAIGGDGPHRLVSDLATRIGRGALDAAAIVGVEALATLARALKAGTEPDGWPPLDDSTPPDRIVGAQRAGSSDAENAAGLIAPMMMYPLLEHALWARSGLPLDAYRLRLGTLAAGFNRVAQTNPYAWSPAPLTAAEIATPAPGNRPVTLPYTKLLNANIQTDQAAALLLCSVQTARALGIASDRWVFLHGAAAAHDHWHVTERADLHSSPAIRRAGAAALADAGAGIDDIAHLDVYSCFPSAVQIGAAELGIDPFTDPRPLTVTGGLTFAGGPGNNYVTHALAAMVGRLREHPDDLGLVTAVGWYLTKHGVGVYGCRPPGPTPRARPTGAELQAEVDALPRRDAVFPFTGPATAESACVIYERDGTLSMGILTALLADGRRALARTHDATALAAMVERPVTDRAVTLAGASGFAFA